MKTIAVVVTFNRFELLKKTISCLRSTPELEAIVVVNNNSTDGTAAWLDNQSDLTVIHQDNVGGAGGFQTGMKRAYAMGADWIWCMDDDVFPRPDCLGNFLRHTDDPKVGIMSPRRLVEGQIFTTEFKEYDLTHTFASTSIDPLRKISVEETTEIAGAAFEGLFISRKVVETIGYPNPDLFIFYDDTDYCIRAYRAGFRLLYVPDALMDKQKFFAGNTWIERTSKKRWKRFYQVRNGAWFASTYGRTWGVKYIRPFISMLGYLFPAAVMGPLGRGYRPADALRFIRAYREGLRGKLGKIKWL